MERSTSNIATLLSIVLAAAFFISAPARVLAAEYVSESGCAECHYSSHEALKDIIGPDGKPGTDPVTVWKADKHSKAYDNLIGSDRATHAATVAHIADPQATQADGSMCLNCHATGVGGNSPPETSEGVSCEACHGAGGDYKPTPKHGAISDPAAMQAAVSLGLIDMRRMDVREKNCRGCHVVDTSKRPCYRPSEKPFNVHNDQKFRHWRDNIPPI